MNRRQKIIVSVTGIFLVLLLLVGLTYAYFLTRITGNTNDKSISVKTANLALIYEDGNGILESAEALVPGSAVKFKTASGETVDKKTFSVTNQGNATTDYVVIIDNVSVVYAQTIEVDGVTQTKDAPTTFESNDFVYTLTCTSGCDGVTTPTTFPIEGGILVGNSIDVDEEQTYELSMRYLETGQNQSNDMNKKLTARINIKDISTINPYSSNTNSLAYNIINNALALTNEEKSLGYAELVATPPTKVAQEVSGENESVLSITADDYGTSYYYRGAVKNNYVNFNRMCWRIVRIEGDGSVKLVLADKDAECSEEILTKSNSASIGTGDYGYTDDGKADYENSANRTTSMKYKFNEWLSLSISEENLELLKAKELCIGDTTKYDDDGKILTEAEATELGYWNYESYVRLFVLSNQYATLKCSPNGIKTNATKIFPLTIDEIVFAGAKNDNYSNYYLTKNVYIWRILSLDYYDGEKDQAFLVSVSGDIEVNVGFDIKESFNLRPAISLIPNIELTSGDGSITNPYVIVTQ